VEEGEVGEGLMAASDNEGMIDGSAFGRGEKFPEAAMVSLPSRASMTSAMALNARSNLTAFHLSRRMANLLRLK